MFVGKEAITILVNYDVGECEIIFTPEFNDASAILTADILHDVIGELTDLYNEAVEDISENP